MAFDADAARKAGYSDAEIAGFLKNHKVDVEGARKAGYSDKEIVDHAAASVEAPAPPAPQKSFTEKLSNFAHNLYNNPPPSVQALASAATLPKRALAGQADFTTDEGISQNIPEAMNLAALGKLGLSRTAGGAGGITAAPAAKLVEDAAATAKATGTAPQAAAASPGIAAVLHSPIADVAAHAGGPKGSMLLAAARKMVGKPAVEAPPPVPTEPWQTPGLPAPGVETGPWGPWANAKSPTGTGLPTEPWSTPQLEDVTPTMADLKGLAKIGKAQQKQQVADTMPLLRELGARTKAEQAAKEAANKQTETEALPLIKQLAASRFNKFGPQAPDQLALPPPSGGPINMPQGPQPLGLPAPAPGPASPFPGPQPGGPMPMPAAQRLALPPGNGAIPMPAPAPQLALPPPTAPQAIPLPVVTAKAISKVNGKVTTTPNEPPPAVDDGIPDFLRRTPPTQVTVNKGIYPAAPPPEAPPALAAPIADTSVMNPANWGTHSAVDAGLLGKYTEAGQHIAENYKNSPNFKGFKTSEQHFGEEVLPPMLEAKHQAAQKLVDVLPTKGSADQLAAHLWGLGRNSAKEFKANLIKEYPQFQAQINSALPDLLMRYWSGGKPKHLQIR